MAPGKVDVIAELRNRWTTICGRSLPAEAAAHVQANLAAASDGPLSASLPTAPLPTRGVRLTLDGEPVALMKFESPAGLWYCDISGELLAYSRTATNAEVFVVDLANPDVPTIIPRTSPASKVVVNKPYVAVTGDNFVTSVYDVASDCRLIAEISHSYGTAYFDGRTDAPNDLWVLAGSFSEICSMVGNSFFTGVRLDREEQRLPNASIFKHDIANDRLLRLYTPKADPNFVISSIDDLSTVGICASENWLVGFFEHSSREEPVPAQFLVAWYRPDAIQRHVLRLPGVRVAGCQPFYDSLKDLSHDKQKKSFFKAFSAKWQIQAMDTGYYDTDPIGTHIGSSMTKLHDKELRHRQERRRLPSHHHRHRTGAEVPIGGERQSAGSTPPERRRKDAGSHGLVLRART
eukprot:TRINITY_DN646_c0_g1_i3.p1 TRINITY_DN646_c0_g1~~TRINITY_DN646_c0_g1_i3.p1  ORF type:complete len:405 (+),score=40.84 TRINITY_DN646_c0_g1_i3:2265-3479(+)